ncbi:hypothetical protein M422DRAFT_777848 [Sphaerobolus stellatus SS14]|nr:hypothetical protein M422DRAFT_777848 [Sphaerobolus stellatus SS14]
MWPQFIVDAFNRCRPDADEPRFYGPWNSILNHCFPIYEGFEIASQFPTSRITPTNRATIDFVVTLTVMKNNATIFFVEIKAPKNLNDQLTPRIEADTQMWNRFFEFYHNSPSKTIGISAFGTRLCFYELDKSTGEITPKPAAEFSQTVVRDVAPLLWWNIDLLEDPGYEKFMRAVQWAKSIVHAELTEA